MHDRLANLHHAWKVEANTPIYINKYVVDRQRDDRKTQE